MRCPVCEEKIDHGYILKIEVDGVIREMVGCKDCATSEPEESLQPWM